MKDTESQTRNLLQAASEPHCWQVGIQVRARLVVRHDTCGKSRHQVDKSTELRCKEPAWRSGQQDLIFSHLCSFASRKTMTTVLRLRALFRKNFQNIEQHLPLTPLMHPTTKLQWNFLLLLLNMIIAKNPPSPLQCLFCHTKAELLMVFLLTITRSIFFATRIYLTVGLMKEAVLAGAEGGLLSSAMS